MKKIRFTTLYPECRNIDLVKDVGQIPYTLAKVNSNIEPTLAGCNIDKNDSNIESIKGLKIDIIRTPFHSFDIAGVIYLFLNAKKIDVLNVYHAGRRAYYFMKIYKCLNKSGKTYLKLDLDFRSCDKYDADKWECDLFKKNISVSDLITVESEAIRDRIQKHSQKKIEILGNGFCKSRFKHNIAQERTNTFITVGRLGTKQKATEVLLDAYAKSSKYHDWNLVLIGSVEEEFKPCIEAFFEENPWLQSRVIFKGEIKDRETLYKEYCKARVFLLPSRWESWGLVTGEALSCGLRVIVSDLVPPMKEMTNNQKFGEIVAADDSEALSTAMIEETKREYNIKEIEDIALYAEQKFSWDRICSSLYPLIKHL